MTFVIVGFNVTFELTQALINVANTNLLFASGVKEAQRRALVTYGGGSYKSYDMEFNFPSQYYAQNRIELRFFVTNNGFITVTLIDECPECIAASSICALPLGAPLQLQGTNQPTQGLTSSNTPVTQLTTTPRPSPTAVTSTPPPTTPTTPTAKTTTKPSTGVNPTPPNINPTPPNVNPTPTSPTNTNDNTPKRTISSTMSGDDVMTNSDGGTVRPRPQPSTTSASTPTAPPNSMFATDTVYVPLTQTLQGGGVVPQTDVEGRLVTRVDTVVRTDDNGVPVLLPLTFTLLPTFATPQTDAIVSVL
jgi:hypothetical protein